LKAIFDGLSQEKEWSRFTAEEERLLTLFFRQWSVEPGHRVLEPGCGTGRLTGRLAEAVGRGGEVTAVDISPGMIAAARARGLPPQVRLICGPVEEHLLADRLFDRIICFNVFPHLVPQRQTLERLVQRLGPSGVFWINHTGSREYINRIHRSGPPSIQDHLIPELLELRHWMTEAGLEFQDGYDGPDSFWISAFRPQARGEMK